MFGAQYLAQLLDLCFKIYPKMQLNIEVYTDTDNGRNHLEVLDPNGNTIVKVQNEGETWMRIDNTLNKLPSAMKETQEATEQGRFGAIIDEG